MLGKRAIGKPRTRPGLGVVGWGEARMTAME